MLGRARRLNEAIAIIDDLCGCIETSRSWLKSSPLQVASISTQRRIGLTKPVAACTKGDATLVADKILAQLSPQPSSVVRAAREDLVKDSKSS